MHFRIGSEEGALQGSAANKHATALGGRATLRNSGSEHEAVGRVRNLVGKFAAEYAGKSVGRLGADTELVLREDGLENPRVENAVSAAHHKLAFLSDDL